MTDNHTDHLAILAGGQSRRMGKDKALVKIQGKRMIDHIVDRCRSYELPIILSAGQDYETGLVNVPDQPTAPAGPVGAIFSLTDYFLAQEQPVRGFYTIPVDAPFAPRDLVTKLKTPHSCAVASSIDQLHPVFAYWNCDIVKSVRQSHDQNSRAPSLHWLARQCNARIVKWVEDHSFSNINTPEDLSAINDK